MFCICGPTSESLYLHKSQPKPGGSANECRRWGDLSSSSRFGPQSKYNWPRTARPMRTKWLADNERLLPIHGCTTNRAEFESNQLFRLAEAANPREKMIGSLEAACLYWLPREKNGREQLTPRMSCRPGIIIRLRRTIKKCPFVWPCVSGIFVVVVVAVVGQFGQQVSSIINTTLSERSVASAIMANESNLLWCS